MTEQWTVSIWDGSSSWTFQREGSYEHVSSLCRAYPPGWIWSVS